MSCENGITSSATPAEVVVENKEYTPSKISNAQDHGTTEKDRAKIIINFFKGKGLPIEVGIGVAGVWSAESHIKTWVYNKAEHDNGYAYKDIHAPNAKTFTYKGQTYYKDQANMMAFGYGKGLAQWSWSRTFKFRDWYNSSAGEPYRSGGPATMDKNGADITGTTVEAQTAFAWEEMQGRTGEFMDAIKYVTGNTASDKETFNKNVKIVVDAVLRGFENGGVKKMASISQIDKYTWSGGYKGSMNTRVSGALGIAEAVKNDYEELRYLR